MNLPILFFDLDDTILDFQWAEGRALAAAFREQGLELTPELLARYREINRRHWELLELGVQTREQTLLRRFEALFAENQISRSAKEVGDRYEQLLEDGHRFVIGAEDLLLALRGRARLFLASNGSARVQESRVASAGLTRYFEDIFISEELGAEKPSAAFFSCCFERIPGFRKDLAMIVGDSLTSDIRGGINAGLKTCWYNPAGRPSSPDIRPDYEIRCLSQLIPLLTSVFGSAFA